MTSLPSPAPLLSGNDPRKAAKPCKCWTFSGESKKKIGHPAPFPIELPKRCIKLFSYVGDIVLDPFMGSGTTVVASKMLDRKSMGIEISREFCELAFNRVLKH